MDVCLETVLDSIEDAILSIDDGAAILFLNDAAGRLFGCVPSHVIGQPVSRYPRISEAVGQLRMDEMSAAGQPAKSIRRFSCPRFGGGDPVPMEATVSHSIVEGRKLVTAVLRDVTFQQQMERAVYEARKTQALGSLASGIAHDFNNVLAAVLSQIDLAMYSPEFPPSLREHLVHAQTSARRGAELVSKLQAFSRQNKPVLGPLDLSDVVEQIVFMLRRSIDPKVVVQSAKPAEKLWLVTADSGQIMQALLNLGINARDAMPKGGMLSFSAENVRFTSDEVQGSRKAGDFVRLSVRDTGLGMPPDVVSRIFEPYFTTKDQSRGPGLGLSITAAMVAEHSGWMEVESQLGRGSVFSIYLPRSQDAVPKRAAAPVLETNALEGKEQILVVDDEELVRMVTKAVLAYRGYRVIEAVDGEDAVAKYSADSANIGLVLMDLHMPKLNGHEALVRIREINPGVRAILLSGGLQEADGRLAEMEHVAFLQKPFENQELLRVVRQLLDSI
ncbi:MAG: response regulator [Verrucomicrobia bacterium]|nr:response regulator [Verrucomicrobiota bacterium]